MIIHYVVYHSLILPIYKSGDRSNSSNYRPISIVPTIAKIVERAVHQQLYDYLSYNTFSPQVSTASVRDTRRKPRWLSSLTTSCPPMTMGRGGVSLLCLLDLSKCFDVIDHSKLLIKQCAHGMIDPSWFPAYLQNHNHHWHSWDH